MNKFTLTAISALAALGFAGQAQAASVASSLFSGEQQLSDNSAEYLVKGAGNADNSILEVGDKLRGILTIETVEWFSGSAPTVGLGTTTGNDELTAIFELELYTKVFTGTQYIYTFGPSASFATEVEGYGWADGTGAAVAFFADSDIEYSRLNDSIAGLENNVTNGDLFWLAGFGDADDYWNAFSGTDDVSAIGALGSSQAGGFYNVAMSLLDTIGGPYLAEFACNDPLTFSAADADFCGSGSLLGTGGAPTPYDSFDNVDFTINVIPEPASLGLMGLGLLGMGALARRRKAA
jgi:hypothetical protein